MATSGRGVIAGGFQVLESVGARNAARLTDVIADTGLPKATARRLLGQLVDVDALQRDGHRYRLGVTMLRFGQRVQPHGLLREAAERPLRRLAEETGMMVGLVGSVSGAARFLQIHPGDHLLPTTRHVGEPASTDTAAARAIVHGAPQIVLDQNYGNGICCIAAGVALPDRARATVCLVMPHKHIPPMAVRSARETVDAIHVALETQH